MSCQDGTPQGRHQLGTDAGSNPGAVGEASAPLQAGAGASVPQEHRARGAQAPEAARNVPALVGTGTGSLLALVDVWGRTSGRERCQRDVFGDVCDVSLCLLWARLTSDLWSLLTVSDYCCDVSCLVMHEAFDGR